ncbi:unnamed protein product, partial [Polarella glacialis]
ASLEEVRRAYRDRLLQAHPDKGGDPEVFQRVRRAWELLSAHLRFAGASRSSFRRVIPKAAAKTKAKKKSESAPTGTPHEATSVGSSAVPPSMKRKLPSVPVPPARAVRSASRLSSLFEAVDPNEDLQTKRLGA